MDLLRVEKLVELAKTPRTDFIDIAGIRADQKKAAVLSGVLDIGSGIVLAAAIGERHGMKAWFLDLGHLTDQLPGDRVISFGFSET